MDEAAVDAHERRLSGPRDFRNRLPNPCAEAARLDIAGAYGKSQHNIVINITNRRQHDRERGTKRGLKSLKTLGRGTKNAAKCARPRFPLSFEHIHSAECHAPMAARMRAQERAPLWNDALSYFSFGEWTRSSSSAKPTKRLSILSSRLNRPTIGIDPPLATSAAGLSHSVSNARRAIFNT